MPRDNPHRPFTPQAAQMARVPEVSGNAINGLGERDFRRPDHVYWAPDPADIPHGDMQLWFYTQSPDTGPRRALRAWRQAIIDASLPEVTGPPVTRTPEDWTAALGGFVEAGFCEKVGVAARDPAWTFTGQESWGTRVLVFGVRHDYDILKSAPEEPAGLEVMHQYGRAARASKEAAAWLRLQGWEAEALTGPMAGKMVMIPPALAAGFGELGKHGSIIDRELGANFRLSLVLTDAPFALTPPAEHGIDAFCAACRICEDACPPEAILPEKQWVRGAEKWYVDFDRCLPFFNETQGCAICIAVCPWSRPGVGPNLADKLARRRARDERGGDDA